MDFVYPDADKGGTADTTESSVAYLYASGRLSGINTATTAYTVTYDTFGNMVSVSAGGNVLATYTYTAGNGKLTRMTYGNGEYEDYIYDNLDRLIKVTYNGSTTDVFTVLYDSNGRLAKAVDGKVGITYLYEYDSLDRLIRAYQKDASGNTIFAVENSYDEYGRAKGSKYVIDGVSRTYNISYKENTNLVSSYTTPGASFAYTYDNFDRLTSKYNPINAYGYSYKEGTSLISSLSVVTGIATPNYYVTTFDYTYNSLGYITNVKKNGTTISTYSYDALGQLTSETVNNQIYVYSYDKAGNITQTHVYTGDIGNLTDTINYTYSTSAWGDLLTNYDGTNISYDSIGNPTNWIGISSLTWDGRELDSITIANNHTVDYTYNADGIRTRKYEYNGNDMYLYDHTYVLDGCAIIKETLQYSSAFHGDSTTILEYYYDESGIASFRYNGTLYYYVKNLQGDVIGIMDNSGAVVVEYTYDAWGNILSVTGSLASTVGQINPFRYRGYYYDSETDLYYLNSRYYDAEVGRFINADSYASTGQGILGNNMFAYCLNNPAMYVDFSGNACHAFSSYIAYNTDGGGSSFDDRYLHILWQTEWLRNSGYTSYDSELEAAQAWANEYKPLSKDYEHVAYIFKIETILGDRYYLSDTYQGSNGNVIPQVLYLEMTKNKYVHNSVSMIHTHPYAGYNSAGKKLHNDYPSTGFIGGGDEWAMVLFGYTEMYVVPYKCCSGTPGIIRYNDKTTWCTH